jgi:hypothetical protein
MARQPGKQFDKAATSVSKPEQTTGRSKPLQHIFVNKQVGEAVKLMLAATAAGNFTSALNIAKNFGPNVPQADVSAVKDAINEVTAAFGVALHDKANLPKPEVSGPSPVKH